MPRRTLPDPFREADHEAAVRRAAITAVRTARTSNVVSIYWLDPLDYWSGGSEAMSSRTIRIELDPRLGFDSFAQVLNAERQIREALSGA